MCLSRTEVMQERYRSTQRATPSRKIRQPHPTSQQRPSSSKTARSRYYSEDQQSGAIKAAEDAARLEKIEARIKHLQHQLEETEQVDALENKLRAQNVVRRLDTLEASLSELEARVSGSVDQRCEMTEAALSALRADTSASLTAFREKVNEVLKSLQDSFRGQVMDIKEQCTQATSISLGFQDRLESLESEVTFKSGAYADVRAHNYDLTRRMHATEALVRELQEEQRRQNTKIQTLIGLIQRIQTQTHSYNVVKSTVT